MPTSINSRFLRINANNTEEPMNFTNVSEEDLKNDKLYEALKGQVQSHDAKHREITMSKYELWISMPDGTKKRHKCEVYIPCDCPKNTPYNHRFMAMTAAGKYKNYGTDKAKSFRKVDENSRAHQIQMTSGFTEWQGDIFIRFAEGKPLPDISFFGDSPLDFINARWFAEGWSRKTNSRKYGKDVARLRACLGVKTRWSELCAAQGGMFNGGMMEQAARNVMFYEGMWIEGGNGCIPSGQDDGWVDTNYETDDPDEEDSEEEGNKCCLCEGEYTHYGNNPHPLNDGKGKCCDDCNATKVIPARLSGMTA